MGRNHVISTSTIDDHATIVSLLAMPQTYPDRPREVRLIETHISRVFLTDRFVYKLKKPVRFDFLDFSTSEKRERACREELRLNRRMTHDVYQAVLPITREAGGGLKLGGSGRAVDWIVQMRRLPAERMLDALIRDKRLTEIDVRRLADYLAGYYTAAEPMIVRPEEFHASLVGHVEGNFRALLTEIDVDAAQIRRIHTPQLRLLKCRPQIFHARALDGRVIDGHGDLRPEHICLLDPPAVFDCLEFSADLRQVDVLDELCFLAMECDAMQAGAAGERVLEAYGRKSHDRQPPVLTTFYKSYRACVRAKVAALRAKQLVAEARATQELIVRRYLDLADTYLRRAGDRPLLILVTGLMGTGKSTLARALADALGAEILRTDELRDELFLRDGRAESFGEGRYRPEARTRIYDELLRRASERLTVGASVILDGTFTQVEPRETALQLCHELGADVFVAECVCPRDVALARIQARMQQAVPDPSEARPELYDRQADEWQCSASTTPTYQLDTTAPLNAQLESVLQAIPGPFRSGSRGS